jgi:hypothetical protein
MHLSVVPALVAACCLVCSVARAEQFIVTDVSYTHSADTTMDSHFRVAPLPGTPSNWKSPVDYSAGSVRVLLEVKTKPTDTPTQFQICFEGSPGYGCTDQSKPYTTTGSYEWTTKFSSFYLGNGGPDWSKGVSQVALILKDTNNGKPQGDPKYVPTDLHVQVAVISGGATFVAPPPSGTGGVGDAGARPLPRDAGSSEDAATGAPAPPRDAGTGAQTPRDAGGGSNAGGEAAPPPPKDGGISTVADAGSHDAGGTGTSKPEPEKDAGCSVGAPSLSGAVPFGLALIMLVVSRRRRATALSARARARTSAVRA